MFILSLIEACLLIAYVGYLVHSYAQKEVHLYVKILTFLSWLLSFGIVLIIPHDIYFVQSIFTHKNIFICFFKNKTVKLSKQDDMNN